MLLHLSLDIIYKSLGSASLHTLHHKVFWIPLPMDHVQVWGVCNSNISRFDQISFECLITYLRLMLLAVLFDSGVAEAGKTQRFLGLQDRTCTITTILGRVLRALHSIARKVVVNSDRREAIAICH